MNPATPEPGKPMPTAGPYYLSRDYEDRLDWLENQRRDRTKRGRGQRVLGSVQSFFATAFGFTFGAFLRRR
jgi:hypothetical protein